MIKATVTFTSYNYDCDQGTAHAFVQNNGKIEIHEFEFMYSIFEPIDDNKDIKNIVNILKNMYGDNIEIAFVGKDYYHDIDYRHHDS